MWCHKDAIFPQWVTIIFHAFHIRTIDILMSIPKIHHLTSCDILSYMGICKLSALLSYMKRCENRKTQKQGLFELCECDEWNPMYDFACHETYYRIFTHELYANFSHVLALHLENQQSVVFGDHSDIPDILNIEKHSRLAWLVDNLKLPSVLSFSCLDFRILLLG